MATRQQTTNRSRRTNRSAEQSPSQIPQGVLDETRERYRQVQRQFGKPYKKTQQELLAQNDEDVIEKRLRMAGLPKRQAKAGASAAVRAKAIPVETLTAGSEMDQLRLERILGVNDLVDVRFLLTGAERTASVGRIRLDGGFATGFLVAPGVVMTNHHVFRRERDARGARIEFGFRELDIDGNLATPSAFRFDTDRLFFNDSAHDVAIVALGSRVSGTIDPTDLPFCRLMEQADAVIAGERLNIIQHPAGEPKQVALRDNTAIAVLDEMFLHYRSDTKRGSSGSPVFTDEWDLVGLHHSGVPDTDSDGNWLDINGDIVTDSTPDHMIAWIANEAIQSAALFRLLGNEDFRGSARDLVNSILNPPDADESTSRRRVPSMITDPRVAPRRRSVSGGVAQADGTVRVTVPVEISVRIGNVSGASASDSDAPSELSRLIERMFEDFGIDDDYSNRNGYQEDFLDEDLPLPGLTEEQQEVAALNREPIDGDDSHVLRYHNFSVVMNGERKIPFYTAVNIDGSRLIRISRDDDGGEHDWIADRRIGAHEQTNNDHYKGRTNRLDRGHLVRRLDPGWGETEADSARGIVDTFHYANCTPQYDSFNRRDDSGSGPANGLWLGLENFVLDNAEDHDQRVSVFTGPVFRDSDPDFEDNGIRIPTQYWKVIAWCDEDGNLQAAAFLLSQKQMLDDDPRIERMAEELFDFRERDLFETTVSHIAELTDLDFGPLAEERDDDESFRRTPVREIRRPADVRLP